MCIVRLFYDYRKKMSKHWSIYSSFVLAVVVYCTATQFTVTDQVYIDFTSGGKDLGRVVIGLFGEDAPKTVKNFLVLATEGIDGNSYAGSKIHRVIKKFIIQGGDIVSGDGRGSVSIYGKYFEDENLQIKHTGSGFIAMANRGPDTNGCQFYITTMAAPWLDGKHTIFGKVVEGQRIVHAVEHVKTDMDDLPVEAIFIKDCGVIDTPKPFVISDEPYDLWAWVKASTVPLSMSFSILGLFHWMLTKL